MSTTTYSRGDVVLVWCLEREGDALKKRPALVVQSDSVRSDLGTLVVCPVISQKRRATGAMYRIAVERAQREGRRMGLLSDSVILCDDIHALPVHQFTRHIGTCGLMDKVDAAIRSVCGLEMPDARSPGPSDIT